jgi:hypothetical protein
MPMTKPQGQTPAQRLIGDFAPKLVQLTDVSSNWGSDQ